MAKKGSRILIGFICDVCKSQNYITTKNKVNTPTALKLKKYCRQCRKHTQHKEIKKLD